MANAVLTSDPTSIRLIHPSIHQTSHLKHDHYEGNVPNGPPTFVDLCLHTENIRQHHDRGNRKFMVRLQRPQRHPRAHHLPVSLAMRSSEYQYAALCT